MTRCRVYWGSHGCDLPRGHDGHHLCSCCTCPPGTVHPNYTDDEDDENDGCVGAFPYYGPETNFSGEDVTA